MQQGMEVKYPNVKVDFAEVNGNAFAVIGAVKKALRRNGVSDGEQARFFDEATAGDYNHVLQTCMKWVTVEYNDATAEEADDGRDQYIEYCDECGEDLNYCECDLDEDEDDEDEDE